MKKQILVVGGGFAGVKACMELCDSELFNVTLVSQYEEMRIYGSLYQTITGGSKKISSIPLNEIFADRNIKIIFDKAISIDRKAKEVRLNKNTTLLYDILILGLGSQTNYFGIEGLEEYSYGMKSLEEADELKAHIHDQIVNVAQNKSHFVVVGGGPTGIELAGELLSYLYKVAKKHGIEKPDIHVDLVEASPRLLPMLPKAISRSVLRQIRKMGVRVYLGTAVLGQTADELLIHGKPIRSHSVVWTAGMSNNSFFKENNFQLSSKGKVRVDQFLQAEPGIFVLGDNADTPYNGMAQTALYDGVYTASHLINLETGSELVPYKAKKPVYVLPAGPKWAAVLWGKVKFYGYLGWLLRRLADFVQYKDYEKLGLALDRFVAEDDKEESCKYCSLVNE